MNDTVQAVAHYEKYLELQPDDWETQFHVARLYLQQKENEKARDCLENIFRVKPDMPGLAAALGSTSALLKKLPEAEKYYRLAERAQPNAADIHCALGQVLLKEQKFPEAEAEFGTALKLDPHSRDAAIGLASSLDLEQRYQEAIPILEQLVHAPDPAPYVFFTLATCYDHLMARKEALANYEHFLELARGKFPDQEWQATQRAKLLRRVLSK
jgi:tetratricopeptide (TPR) repeat protein